MSDGGIQDAPARKKDDGFVRTEHTVVQYKQINAPKKYNVRSWYLNVDGVTDWKILDNGVLRFVNRAGGEVYLSSGTRWQLEEQLEAE